MFAEITSQLTPSGAFLSLVASVVVYYVLDWFWLRVRYDWHKIPGPPTWPLLGDIPDFLRFAKGDPKMHEYAYHWWIKLGKPKVFRRSIMGRRILIVCDPACVQNDLTGHRGLPKSQAYDSFSKLFGERGAENIFLRKTTDSKWKAIRKNVAQAFSTENLKKTFPVVLDTAKQLMDELAKVPSGRALEVRALFTYFTFEVISSWGMGVKTDAIRSQRSPFLDAQSFCTDEVMRDAANPLRKLAKRLFPFTDMARQSKQGFRNMYAAIDDLYCKMKQNAPPEDDFTIASCLLRAKTSLPDDPFSDDELKSEAAIFFFAGTDTTSQQLQWALCCLACHKDVEARLASELIDAGLAGPTAREPTFDELRKLPYLNAFIKETLRVLPAVALGSPRGVPEDMTIFGYKIPKGTDVAGQAFMLNRMDAFYDKPEVFDPDRWLNNEQPTQQYDPKSGTRTLWTFSNGPRDCIGQRLAIMEMQIVLSMFVSRFSVELDERMGGWEGVMAKKYDKIVSTCKGGMWVKLFPRG